MKKIILCIVAAISAAGVFAQNSSDLLKEIEDKVITGEEKVKQKKEKEWKVFDGSILSTYGFGYLSLVNSDFTEYSKGSREIFINLGEVRYSPAKPVSFTAGIDIRWDSFETLTEGFSVGTDNLVTVVPAATGADRNFSEIRFTSVVAPLRIRANIGIITLVAGADLFLRYRRNVINTAVTGNMTTETTWKKVGADKFSWNVTTAVEVFGMGFYYRYFPEGVFPSGGMKMNYNTIGLYFTLF